MTSHNLEHFLKCTDCKKYFDDDSHAPHVLPCLHTCCTKCLKSRVIKEEVQCPECAEKFEASQNDISNFPVDTARKHIVDCYRIQKKNADFNCDECGNSSNKERATMRCKECNEFLCTKCTDAHQRTKLTKRHQLISLETLKNSPLEEFHTKQTCSVEGHEGQPFSFFCTSKTCTKPICSLCVVRDHQQNGHEVRNINDVYVENKRQVEGQLLDIKHMKTSADEAIEHIEDEIQNLYLKENAVDEELDAHFAACIKTMEKRKEELKEKLASVSQNKKKDLDGQLDRLTKQKGQLDQTCKFTDDHLQYSNAAEFLLMKDQILNRMYTLKDQSVETVPHATSNIKFQTTNLGDDFSEFCQNMGDVWATSIYLPNTRVQVLDIATGREQCPLLITLSDYQNRPLHEPGVDIKVDIFNSKNHKTLAHVQDKTRSQGCYKVAFTASRPGEYRAVIKIMGTVLEPGEYVFKAKHPDQMESEDSLADLTPKEKKGNDETGVQNLHVHVQEPNGNAEVEKLNLQGLATSRSSPVTSHKFKAVGDIICPDMSLNHLTVHPQNELLENQKTLTNQKGRHRPPRNLSQAFQNFRGTIANRSMGRTGQYYFEVNISFFIKRSLRQDLIFEVGLCRKPDVDKHYTIDNHQFSYVVCARKCHICRTICLQGWSNGQRFYHAPITENSPPGTSFKTTYGFLLDTRQRQWVVIDVKSRKFILRFKHIDLNKPLWPVFGLYNPDLVNSSLTLRSGKDISTILEVPFDL
ncbi:E3 ubiquitin-protein ligase TRIM45-like [Saccostrea cucullata]|uniref:E3 ubiquitin-protein ligase TRIM45-like n=1 Tax=Saccostrea cuccullata TaxID=36930 RepID=UPI002ED6619B